MLTDKTIDNWLDQFTSADRLLAKSLLNSLTFISSTEFIEGIHKKIYEISQDFEGKTALFPIRKIPKCTFQNPTKNYRKQYSSADMIGYGLTQLERENEKRYIVEPTIECMRAEKIKNIILVDDIIGTGQRVITYWKHLDKSIKSWISSKKCKIWLITYAAHEIGLEAITKTIAPLNINENIYNQIHLQKQSELNQHICNLCIKYAINTSKSSADLGFRSIKNLIIFEFSCPNNSPAILWANGKQWKALFPNRSIPNELKSYLTKNNKNQQLNLLFDTNLPKFAITLMDELDNHKMSDHLFYTLSLLNLIQKGFKYQSLVKYITLSKSDINHLLQKCIDNKLIVQNSHFLLWKINAKYKLTNWGKELLKKYQFNNNKGDVDNDDLKKNSVYFPLQFKKIPAKN